TLVTAVRETPETVTDVRWYPAEQAHVIDDEPDALVEPIVPDPLLVIVGGGHVAQALAWQADLVGFDLLVVEDRPEYARPDLFPPRAEVRCGDAAGILAGMSLDEETYVALVSRGHLTDAKALAACIDKPCRYIGMMGSRRKAALLRQDFLRRGLATAERFDRVHAPIGLDLGGRTVPEIAAGIVAELIAARHQRRTPAARDETEAARP
ncbi:MAG: XdhC family protein, partial [Phycisphaerae bacterium]